MQQQQQQQVSPTDSCSEWQRSSFSSSRASFSTTASSTLSPPKMEGEHAVGGLATPTTPSAFQQPPRHVALQPIHPPPQLQPISTLAAFAGELFVWLWFAPPTLPGSTAPVKASKQQLAPSERFLRFCHDVLATTQVSHSVVILALLFISRLKSRNSINGSPGSEFRSSVTALMLANKILDDNTYTAKTWADVSALELKPLVAGEAEFLRGLGWNLHVTERDFASWLKLLEGLVSARNSQVGGKSMGRRVGSKSGRNVSAGNGGTELLGLGLGVGLTFAAGGSVTPSGRSTKRAREEDGSASNDRRRSSGGVPMPSGGAHTTHNTPQSRFATFSFPSSIASAPHAGLATAPLHAAPYPSSSSSSSLPISPLSSRRTSGPSLVARGRPPYARHQHSLSIPPPITTSDALRPSSATKRRADDAFGSDTSPPHPSALEAPAPKRLQAAFLARSFSAGASPAPQRAVFVHPGHSFPSTHLPPPAMLHHPPPSLVPQPYQPSPTEGRFALPPLAVGMAPDMGRVLSSGGRRREGGGGETLADAWSPRYDPRQGSRPESLGFYSLGGKHEYHVQMAPHAFHQPPHHPHSRPTSSGSGNGGYLPPPLHQHAHHPPSHLSTHSAATSPALSPLSQYHTGAPFHSVAHGHSPPESTASFAKASRRSSAPLQLQPVPFQRPPPLQYSMYSNAGMPGVFWQGGGGVADVGGAHRRGHGSSP